MEDIRNHLFAALERLGDEKTPPSAQELARAKAVSEVAKTLIDSARVEVDFLKVRSLSSRANPLTSDFIENSKALPALESAP